MSRVMGMDTLLSGIRDYRMVWLDGRFSGGKTAMAMRLAWEYKKRYGYRVVTNTAFILNEQEEPDFIYEDGSPKLKLIVVIDEGGLYLQSNDDVMRWMAFAGKMDIVCLVPSISPPAAILRSFDLQKIHHYRSIGVPLDVYQWAVKMGSQKFTGKVKWMGMEEIFGTYSTLHPSSSPTAVINFVEAKAEQFKILFKADANNHWLNRWDTDGNDDETNSKRGGQSEVGILENAAFEIAKAADTMSTVHIGREKRGRRGIFQSRQRD